MRLPYIKRATGKKGEDDGLGLAPDAPPEKKPTDQKVAAPAKEEESKKPEAAGSSPAPSAPKQTHVTVSDRNIKPASGSRQREEELKKSEKDLNKLRMHVKNSNDKLHTVMSPLGMNPSEHDSEAKSIPREPKQSSNNLLDKAELIKQEQFFENFEILKMFSLGCMSKSFIVRPYSKKSQILILKAINQYKFSKTKKKWKQMGERYI
jgi:hypothetical protein